MGEREYGEGEGEDEGEDEDLFLNWLEAGWLGEAVCIKSLNNVKWNGSSKSNENGRIG